MVQLVKVDSDIGEDCLVDNLSNNSYDGSFEESFCNAVWDTVYCWPPTPPGSQIKMPCSEIFNKSYAQYAASLKGYAYRECLENGTWKLGTETNYDECRRSFEIYVNGVREDNVIVPLVHQLLFWGSIVSLLFLGSSLLIYYKFRCLQCDRVTVHAQLMLSLLLRFLLMLIISEPFVIGHTASYRDVEILCEFILVLFLYSTFSSISWMFVEGLYLNTALVKGVVTTATTHQLTIYHLVGWGVPAGFVGVYVISMSLKTQERCWEGYSKMDEMWILLGPITLELVINGISLLNILRILLRKVRNSTSWPDSSQLKSAAKATVLLFPVLGINNLILLYNPGGDYNKYFVILNTFFGATQGIFVSIVFCFADKDVRAAIWRSIERASTRRMGDSNRAATTLPLQHKSSVEMMSYGETQQLENTEVENECTV